MVLQTPGLSAVTRQQLPRLGNFQQHRQHNQAEDRSIDESTPAESRIGSSSSANLYNIKVHLYRPCLLEMRCCCCLSTVTGRGRFLYGKQVLAVVALSFYLLVFTTFLAPFKISITLSPSATLHIDDDGSAAARALLLPATKFAFMKNHKCASTTVDSIIFRFAERNDLNLVLPATGNYLSTLELFDHKSLLNKTQWKDLEFDVFCLHNRWHRKEVMAVLREETVPTFTVVRDPVDVFVSMFHFQDPFRRFYGAKDIHDMVDKVANASMAAALRQRWMGSIGRNQMAWDLGLSPDIYDDAEAVQAEIRRLDGEFDLVMVTDRMEESLVLLKDLLRWSTDDVVHLNLNRRKSEKSPKLTAGQRQVLAKWLAADVQIYEHFSRRFDQRVSQFNALYGSFVLKTLGLGDTPMQKELHLLQAANKKLYKRCVLKEVGNEKLRGQYQWVNNNVVGFLINEKENGCASFARSELAYLKIFENRLYAKLKAKH